MKAYKRQKIAMIAILIAAGMSGTAFASSTFPVSPNDITDKPFVTKMHKEEPVAISKKNSDSKTKRNTKKRQ